jgi:lysophospholipase L1-like esterase
MKIFWIVLFLVAAYIAAGDGTSVGKGASDFKNICAYKVADFLAKDRIVHYKNIGVIEARTSGVLQNRVNDVIAFKPDVVTILIAANDSTHLESPAKF